MNLADIPPPQGNTWKTTIRQIFLFILALALSSLYFNLETLDEEPQVSVGVRFASSEVHGHFREVDHPHVHITHVFNSYPTDRASLDRVDQLLVTESWKHAARVAKAKGINVEFLDAVLAKDIASSPSFSRIAPLKEYIREPFKNRTLPIVGEIFQKAKTIGRGEWVIYTNYDIGVMPDFYLKSMELANQDLCDDVYLRKLLNKCFEHLVYCIKYRAISTSHNVGGCAADMEGYFVRNGGQESMFPQFQREVARLYVKYKLDAETASPSSPKIIEGWYVADAGGAVENAEADIAAARAMEISGWEPRFEGCKPRDTVLSITRLDVDVNIRSFENQDFGESLKRVYSHRGIQNHPGNDCFVVKRSAIPQQLFDFNHPLSFPKWGKWIVDLFRWNNLAFRQVVGEDKSRYTFHLGVSGAATQYWSSMFDAEPDFILFLHANWYMLDQKRVAQRFDVPTQCQNTAMFRSIGYCGSAPSHDYCDGRIHLGCGGYQFAGLRDTSRYLSYCKGKAASGVPVPDPIHSFCNMLFDTFGIKAKTKYSAAHAPECKATHCNYYVRKHGGGIDNE